MKSNAIKFKLLGMALLVLPLGQVNAAVRYSVTNLTPLLTGNSVFAQSINDAGQVAGWLSAFQAFSYSNGVTQLIEPGGQGAFGINASGQIAGYSGGLPRAFSYTNGVTTDLGTLGGNNSWARGINDSGQVTGEAQITSGNSHAFVTVNGVMTDLGFLPNPPGFSFSAGYAINNSGQVTGVSATTNGVVGLHAFIASATGGMQDLQQNGGVFQHSGGSWGWAINDSGRVAGSAFTADNVHRHAFVTVGNVMTDLGTLGLSSEARGINNAGQVVGFFDSGISNNLGTFRAFTTIDGVMTDLNTLIAPDSGWTLMQATDVNNNGQIVGWGRAPTGHQHSFLLTPVAAVPEPSSRLLFASALLVLGWRSLTARHKKTV